MVSVLVSDRGLISHCGLKKFRIEQTLAPLWRALLRQFLKLDFREKNRQIIINLTT